MSRLDNDVDTLLGKLYVLQESVGGDTLQQAQKKKASASKGKNGRADRFEDVKNDMVERLKNIRQLMTAAADVEKQATSNPKEIIEQVTTLPPPCSRPHPSPPQLTTSLRSPAAIRNPREYPSAN